jgi:cytochrome c biogenesis protein CcmG, thiol:disulfide interchange protein DsbE
VTKSLFIPLGVFVLLVILLALGFGLKDPHFLPSELIDKPFPEFTLADLHDDRVVTEQALTGRVSLVNVWATWCPSCLVEHPELTRIAQDEGVPLIGINYNDDTVKARRWLARHGNPYQFHIVDDTGQLAIKLGVYGAPETYIVDTAGVIRYRHVGAVTTEVWNNTLAPAIQLIQAGAG